MKYRALRGLLAAVALSAAMLPGLASAAPITKTLTLNVYTVCETDGSNCAADGTSVGDQYFSAATNKIWAQAGISVGYNFMGNINNSLFTNIDDAVVGKRFWDIAGTTGNRLSTTVVDMFLVHTVAGAYGEGWLGYGGLVMAMDTILAYATGGRIDTMAHELGHNFGLVPTGDPDFTDYHSLDPNDLMASGGIRHVPLTLADINPSGLGYDQLTQSQIDYARRSTLLSDFVATVPEPASLALVSIALLAAGASRRRRAS